MSRAKPHVPPYRPPPPDEEVEEMPAYKPTPTTPTTLQLAPEEAQDALEPELPLPAPEMHQRLQAASAAALSALPDPTGQDQIVKWAARIEVLQAYQFRGALHSAPAWIDRNWLSWDGGGGIGEAGDDVRREPGPALNVTRKDGSHVGMCLHGDYVCRQNTTVDDPEVPGGLRMLPDHLAVVPKAEFERLFRPVKLPNLGDVTLKPQAA